MARGNDPRAAILARKSSAVREPLEGVDGAFVHKLSVDEWDELAKAKGRDSTFRLFALAVRDEAGARLFSDADVDELRQLVGTDFRKWSNQVQAFNEVTSVASAEKN